MTENDLFFELLRRVETKCSDLESRVRDGQLALTFFARRAQLLLEAETALDSAGTNSPSQ